jgi:hypothetical protein
MRGDGRIARQIHHAGCIIAALIIKIDVRVLCKGRIGGVITGIPFCVQQGIAIQLFGNKGFDLKVLKRQQLDGLLQLWRHYQRLALSQVKARAERHDYRLKPSPR